MRIISGSAKGRKLKLPMTGEVRPPMDRMKESYFDIFQFDIAGASFLDIFSGSGSMGLEALSRGAKRVVFIEKSNDALEVIRENLHHCDFAKKGTPGGFGGTLVPAEGMNKDSFELLAMGALEGMRLMAERAETFDFIFMDPPFKYPDTEGLLEIMGRGALMEEGCVLCVHHHKKRQLEEKYGILTRYREGKYGQSLLSFYKKASD